MERQLIKLSNDTYNVLNMMNTNPWTDWYNRLKSCCVTFLKGVVWGRGWYTSMPKSELGMWGSIVFHSYSRSLKPYGLYLHLDANNNRVQPPLSGHVGTGAYPYKRFGQTCEICSKSSVQFVHGLIHLLIIRVAFVTNQKFKHFLFVLRKMLGGN